MNKAILVLGLVATAAYGAWRWFDDAPATTSHTNLTVDRLWIDHIPRNDRDTIQIFAVLTEEPLGVFNAASQWKGAFEIFRYEAHGDEIRAVFPQTGDREKIRAKATRCNENHMDYCLELSGSSRGVKRYYSRKGWELDGARSLDDVTHRATKALDAAN